MEEKFFMEGGKKRLNVACYQERGMKQEDGGLCYRAEMGGLADLACRFILAIFVGVGSDLGNKDNEHQCQTDRQHSGETGARVQPDYHFSFQITPGSVWTPMPL